MSNNAGLGPFKYIDINQFEELNGTVEIFPAVARVFTDLLPSWLEEVQAGVDQQDGTDLADKLHKMKGCCGMMGAYGLSKEIAALEKQIGQSGVAQNIPLLNEVVLKIKEMDAEVARLARP